MQPINGLIIPITDTNKLPICVLTENAYLFGNCLLHKSQIAHGFPLQF